MTAEALIFDTVRTPRGAVGGSLAKVRPVELVGTLLDELVAREIDVARVDDVTLGCNTQTGAQGANIAKTAVLWAGWPTSVAGGAISRFCASGLDAVISASAKVMAGFADLVVAGGVESMSQVPMLSDQGPWFADPEVAGRTGFVHMGIAADLIASHYGISRPELDAYAARSHQRADRAWNEGRFSNSVVPVAGLVRDEHIRPTATAEKLAGFEPAFSAFDDGTAASRRPDITLEFRHTVATSPGMVDAASAVVVGSRVAGERAGLSPRARVVAAADHSVEPVLMLDGVTPALQKALDRAGMRSDDLDVIECNESFAAVPLMLQNELGIDDDRLNPNGGAIAMGHPLGATGGILVGTLLDELERRDGAAGAVTIPGGGGIAQALVVERL